MKLRGMLCVFIFVFKFAPVVTPLGALHHAALVGLAVAVELEPGYPAAAVRIADALGLSVPQCFRRFVAKRNCRRTETCRSSREYFVGCRRHLFTAQEVAQWPHPRDYKRTTLRNKHTKLVKEEAQLQASGSRIDIEIPNVQDYLLGISLIEITEKLREALSATAEAHLALRHAAHALAARGLRRPVRLAPAAGFREALGARHRARVGAVCDACAHVARQRLLAHPAVAPPVVPEPHALAILLQSPCVRLLSSPEEEAKGEPPPKSTIK